MTSEKNIFAKTIMAWFGRFGRKELPWKAPDKHLVGYYTLVSEIMLQQTTVATVKERFPLFVERFPTFEALASASQDDVMKAWEGLGYYARARRLHHAAKIIMSEHQGKVPEKREERLELPGVGPTTASALGAFVFNKPEPIWDANVARIFRRYWKSEWEETTSSREWKKQWNEHGKIIPDKKAALWTQAIMDFGSLICTPKKPLCVKCPLHASCQYYAELSRDILTLAAFEGEDKNKNTGDYLSTTRKKDNKKQPKKVIWRNWVVLENEKGDEVALLKPQEKGLWPGLWQLPYTSLQGGGQSLEHGRHLLTHRVVMWSVLASSSETETFDPFQFFPEERIVWVSKNTLKTLAFPKPLQDFWASHP